MITQVSLEALCLSSSWDTCLPLPLDSNLDWYPQHQLSGPQAIRLGLELCHWFSLGLDYSTSITIVLVVQALSRVRLFATPWTAAHQASLPSLSPRVCSDSHPLCWRCQPTISSSVVLFSSSPQSFPETGSYPMSRLCASGGQNIGASALASVFSVDTQGWFPLGLTGLVGGKKLHNHMSQFLIIISVCVSIHVSMYWSYPYILWVLFLWGTLTNIRHCSTSLRGRSCHPHIELMHCCLLEGSLSRPEALPGPAHHAHACICVPSPGDFTITFSSGPWAKNFSTLVFSTPGFPLLASAHPTLSTWPQHHARCRNRVLESQTWP